MRGPAGREQVGDLAQLVEHGPPRRLGRVGGEHRPHAEPPDLGGQLSRGMPAAAIRSTACDSQPPSRSRMPGQLAPAVHLLGHVGQVEVGA